MFLFPKRYDVVVVGAGHAGCEAALSAARMGAQVAVLSQNLDTIGQMSCNPAIGGLAKGHMVREIDALGGAMALNTDATAIQFRMLNSGKGPSVRAPRAQADKKAYQFRMKWLLESEPNLDLHQGNVSQILVRDGSAVGVTTALGVTLDGKTLVITTGTFMRGLLHVGLRNLTGGRMGDPPSTLSDCLRDLGFEVCRLKTGTPCRLNGRSIDFSRCQRQPGDTPPPRFSFLSHSLGGGPDDIFTLNAWADPMFHVEQIPCWTTYTNHQTHEIIRANLDKSPMYTGQIQGIGPRYCPSIEDKVVRFAEKDRHQLFLEPEGRHTREFYVNGISTSLPYEVQLAFLHTIQGLENAEIIRPGYAVEYDFCPPTQLHSSLETKLVENLFFAGQINGTSGYEEAAGQGIMAGINAARKVANQAPVILGRHEAYIGVMIDDLVTKGVTEPYRMFTSRAEHRLLLRQDNADLRLTPLAADIPGLICPTRAAHFQSRRKALAELLRHADAATHEGLPLRQWLKRPENSFLNLPPSHRSAFPDAAWELAENDIKYAGYIQRQQRQVEKLARLESLSLPQDLNFLEVPGLKKEAQQRLHAIRPATLGQAARVSGVTPADISLLTVWLHRGRRVPTS